MHIKKLPLFFISVLLHQFAVGQCSYNLPDTVCPFQNIGIASPGNLSADQCSERLDSLLSIQTLPALLSGGTYQFRMIKENDRYFIVTNAWGSPNIRRYEFNSKFDALLNISDITPINDNITGSLSFDMVKIDSLKWVAFKADYTNSNLYRIEFDSLTDDSLTFQLLGNFGISSPASIKIFGNYLFVSNDGNHSISKIHFDSTFQNVLDSAVITGLINGPRQMDVIHDCISDNYYGYVSNYNSNLIVRMDFGNTLSNDTPALTTLTPSLGSLFALKMYSQDNAWYCFTGNISPTSIKLLKFDDPENLNPVLMLDTPLPSLTFPAIDFLIDSSQLHVISAFNMVHFTFAPKNCSNGWTQGIDSINFNFDADTGWQHVEIALEGINHETYYTNDSVYVFISPPVASFTTNGTCEGLPINFTDASELCYGNIVSWQWSFGDSNTSTLQNPSHTYSAGGTYTVTLTVYTANNDSSTYSMDISLVPVPVAEYTPSSFSACASYPIQFNDSSTAVNDSVVSWLWYFGTQDSSTIQNPSYTYNTAGVYDVQLIATNSSGCMDTVSKSITILPAPLAQFTLTGTCAGGTVTFTNLTDSATNPVVNYNWYFGNNNDSSQVADPFYQYPPVDSTYNVQLIATAANNCATTFTSDVTITHPPLVSFTISEDTVCKNVPIFFINTSTTQNINDSIVYRRWEFSDGFFAYNVDTVIHAFTQSGIAWVTLTVVTATYCDSTNGVNLLILDNPAADFTYTNVCFNDSNLFTNISVPASGDNIVSYSWNFGDSTALANVTPAYHTYSDTGLYNVLLTVISSKGCTDSITKAVNVYELPVANFITPNFLCNDSATQFTDFTYINTNDTLNLWGWNFGNSNTSTIQNPSNIYAQPGTYNVQLMVATVKGCRDTILKQVTVKLSPSPSFTFDSICNGYNTHFYFDDLTPPPDTVNAWNWDFGEQGSGNNTLENPADQYILPGTYNVTVTATNVNQCFKSFSQPVTIHPNPVIGFTTSNPCEKYSTLFTDTSIVIGDSVTQWNWVINASLVSTAPTANYTFSSPGSYLVQLTATSSAGCSSDSVIAVDIYSNPIASFTESPSYAIPNQSVIFTNTSQNAVSYLWNFGDGNSSVLTSPVHAFADTNVYNISLIATSNEGCTDTAHTLYNVLIPYLEIAVVDINSQIQNNLLTLSAKFVNLGNINIENYKVVANVAELPSLVEFSTLPLSVASGAIGYTLKTKVELSTGFDPGYFCIEVQKPNGVDDQNLLNNRLCKSIETSFELLNIVPNPAIGDIQLYINSPFQQDVSIEIYDNISRLAVSNVSNLKKGFNSLIVESSHLSKGVYFLRLYNGSVQIKSTFVKQ